MVMHAVYTQTHLLLTDRVRAHYYCIHETNAKPCKHNLNHHTVNIFEHIITNIPVARKLHRNNIKEHSTQQIAASFFYRSHYRNFFCNDASI